MLCSCLVDVLYVIDCGCLQAMSSDLGLFLSYRRFTEFYIEEMKSTEDLRQLILSYFPGIDLSNTLADGTIR